MGKTIMICPHCGRLAWLPEVTCVHCSCLMTNYRRWIAANDEGKKEILSKINQPKAFKPMENQEWLDEADKTDAKIRRYLEKEKEQAEIEAAKPKYTPKCPTCGCPNVERIGFGEKIVDTAVWGFLARKPKCQFRCKNCGYEW